MPFLFNDTPAAQIYTLSLHDALPISHRRSHRHRAPPRVPRSAPVPRSEEHTSELQSRENLVCRLLLEKKNMIDRIQGLAKHGLKGVQRQAAAVIDVRQEIERALI